MSDTEFTPIPVERIMEMIPHRYPILLVDRLIAFKPGESATGLKNVTVNEPHFLGHFPNKPVMPGVLIIEALAQTAAIMVVNTYGAEAEGKLVYFMTIDESRFRKPVVPGDTLHLEIETIRARGAVWKFRGFAKVDGKVHAEATFSAMIMDRPEGE
ncbi:MAG: 3-hydroxyacyl-ACP dehydratase FabZ [Pseudobdellovibrionaceae bacterium]|jgi:3-hydroxyacyl-[acyl-carrier-protein] dehydratase